MWNRAGGGGETTTGIVVAIPAESKAPLKAPLREGGGREAIRGEECVARGLWNSVGREGPGNLVSNQGGKFDRSGAVAHAWPRMTVRGGSLSPPPS